MAGTQLLFLDLLATDVEQSESSDLLSRARAGDQAAFGRIVAEHEDSVMRVAWRLVRNTEDARDIAQETFLRLHRHVVRLSPDRDPGPWLYRVTDNLALTALRSRRRNPEAPLVDDSRDPALSAGRHEQERRCDAADSRRVIGSLLDQLSEKERAAIVLRDLEGLDVNAVAQALGCRQGTVRAHLSRGRLKLRKALEAQGGRP